jgi:hypothetical protein
LKSKASKSPILGYTDTSTVKLDYDKMKLKKVKYYAQRIKKWFRLEGFIILKSSKDSYHVLFNKTVSWTRNAEIMGWACFISSFNLPLMRYVVMQLIKKQSTLRVGFKRRKSYPKIVFRSGKQNCEIKYFLEYRKFILEIERKRANS